MEFSSLEYIKVLSGPNNELGTLSASHSTVGLPFGCMYE